MMLPSDVIERSELVSERWLDVLTAVESQYDTPPVFQEDLESFHEYVVERFPHSDEYQDNIATQYVRSRTFGDVQLLTQVLEAYPHDDVVRSILAELVRRPAFYAAFTITAKLDDNLYEIEELEQGTRYTIHSPGLQEMQYYKASRAATYISLLVDNGRCLQPVSMFHYSRLNKRDFDFIGHVVDEALYEESGLDGLLKAYPRLFVLLSLLHEIPHTVFRGVELVAHLAPIGPVSHHFEKPYWNALTVGEAKQYIFAKASTEMVDSWGDQLFFEVPHPFNIRLFNLAGGWYLMTHSQESFNTFAAMMGYPSLRVQHRCSIALILFLEELGYSLPWAPFSLMDEDEMDQGLAMGGTQKMAQLNALIDDYMDAYNEGRPVDLRELAIRHGMNPHDVDRIMDTVEAMLSRHSWQIPPEEEAYQLDGDWSEPSPVMLWNFDEGLSNSQVFFILEESEAIDRFNAHTQGVWREKVEKWGIAELIEELFMEVFEEDDSGYSMLNLLLWIVLHKKDEPVLVRSIVVEAFKLFPYLSQEYDFEPFVELFSDAVIRAGVSTSLLRVKERPRGEARRRGLYTVQASNLLSYLITAIPHSV